MKKIVAFILTITILLSFSTVSFAKVSSENTIKPYIGIWYCNDVYSFASFERNYILSIGNNGEMFVAHLIYSFDNGKDYGGICSYCYEYSLTYDTENKDIYLVNALSGVDYKIRIVDGKINLYDLNMGDNIALIFDKIAEYSRLK